eukprot:TRINITY_DN60346_c0_g1_i1.p1 TRINITY_DN60346_c0_g1~~TRINITY_DN60346_c0_g1_i1.p1  ORF type:complete len:483 (+),score=74.22 TRINITY_DN60346_c0_g1_i1:125-1573(+)
MCIRDSLENAHLVQATLTDANLCNAHCRGSTFDQAKMGRADLTRTGFQGSSLVRAQMQEVVLDQTNLEGAILCGADYDCEALVSKACVLRATIGAMDWSHKDLRRAQLQGCDLQGCNLQSTNLWYADFEGADVRGANLAGAKLDVVSWTKRGWLRGATVGAVDWSGRELRGAQLQSVNLQGANLKKADLTNADLTGSNCSGVNFMNAVLVSAKMHLANLYGVNFYRADLQSSELCTELMDENTYFGHAKVEGAVISKVGWQKAFAVGTLRAEGTDLVLFSENLDEPAFRSSLADPDSSQDSGVSPAEPEMHLMALDRTDSDSSLVMGRQSSSSKDLLEGFQNHMLTDQKGLLSPESTEQSPQAPFQSESLVAPKVPSTKHNLVPPQMSPVAISSVTRMTPETGPAIVTQTGQALEAMNAVSTVPPMLSPLGLTPGSQFTPVTLLSNSLSGPASCEPERGLSPVLALDETSSEPAIASNMHSL